MLFTPGQAVIVLDTLHRPAGQGTVVLIDADTQLCQVLFHYPGKSTPENIPVPMDRLLLNTVALAQP